MNNLRFTQRTSNLYLWIRCMCRCGTQWNYTSHNVDLTLVLLHPEPMCQWDTLQLLCASRTQRRQKKYASVRRTHLHMMVAVLCLTLNPGQAKLLTKDKESAWHGSRDLIGQNEASVIWGNTCKLGRIPGQRKCKCKLVRGIPHNCSLVPSGNGKLLIPKQWSMSYQRFRCNWT